MTLRDDRIDEFVELWERAFGERVTRDQARTKAHQLLELYRAIAEDVRHQSDNTPPPPTTDEPASTDPSGGSG